MSYEWKHSTGIEQQAFASLSLHQQKMGVQIFLYFLPSLPSEIL